MGFNDDRFLDVCQNIEAGLKKEYERNASLTDSMCILALEAAKLAVKKGYPEGRFELDSVRPEFSGIVNWCVTVAQERIGDASGLTLPEYLTRIEKVKRSVRRHSREGRRSYYEFVRGFLP